MKKVKVGIIGCGKISSIYIENCQKFQILELIACADINISRAQEQAKQYGIPLACTVEELLAIRDIEMIINLTVPAVHAQVTLKALHAGKHVYVEKPLTATMEEGKEVLDTAKRLGLRIGSAPDTFLGAGIQTALELINQGTIGRPVSATAFMMSRGHEFWHPDPEFYYEHGGGPMFDMGPYYLTALVQLLGPIRMIAGITGKAKEERIIQSEKKYGNVIPVKIPTHVAGTLQFENGAIASLITSFDVFGGSTLPPIEIHGTEGTLLVPDPNTFGGPVKYRKTGETKWTEQPLLSRFSENYRGLGPAEMAYALQHDLPHRASGELAYHILEAMYAFHVSSDKGTYYTMTSHCKPPAPLPPHLEL